MAVGGVGRGVRALGVSTCRVIGSAGDTGHCVRLEPPLAGIQGGLGKDIFVDEILDTVRGVCEYR